MTIRDFDEMMNARLAQPIEERQFQLRGYTFTLRPSIRPEAMSLFLAIGAAPDDAKGADAVREFMDACLVDGEIGWWDELRQRTGDDALTVLDMTMVAAFALERIVGRPPTKLPSSGQTSDEPTSSTDSKDGSSLRAVGSKD